MKNKLISEVRKLDNEDLSSNEFLSIENLLNEHLGFKYVPIACRYLENKTNTKWYVEDNMVSFLIEEIEYDYDCIEKCYMYENHYLDDQNEFYSKSIYVGEHLTAVIIKDAILIFANENQLTQIEIETEKQKEALLNISVHKNYARNEEIIVNETAKIATIFSIKWFYDNTGTITPINTQNEEVKTFHFDTEAEAENWFSETKASKRSEGFVNFFESNFCKDLIAKINLLSMKCTELVATKSKNKTNSQLKSNFGGNPYFEINEEWPLDINGEKMQFLFQIINKEGVQLPEEIKILQLYYGDTDSYEQDFLIKTYTAINESNIKLIETDSNDILHCDIQFVDSVSFPGWSLIKESDQENFKEIKNQLTELFDYPEDKYVYLIDIIKDFRQEDYRPEKINLHCQLGGYPNWIHNDETPENSKLLFQLESNLRINFMFKDAGFCYGFYNKVLQQALAISQG